MSNTGYQERAGTGSKAEVKSVMNYPNRQRMIVLLFPISFTASGSSEPSPPRCLLFASALLVYVISYHSPG